MPETSRSARYREYMRYFNTSGPCHPDQHYMLPPEPRLPDARRVVEPLLVGDLVPNRDPVYDDDIAYVRDLGLIAERPPIRVANPIYKEVIVRALTAGIQES